MENWLKCIVSPGQFSVEYAIQADAADGSQFSLFAPKEVVEVEREPSDDDFVDGFLKVNVADRANDSTLVYLPREAFEIGYFVTVKSASLESRSLEARM